MHILICFNAVKRKINTLVSISQAKNAPTQVLCPSLRVRVSSWLRIAVLTYGVMLQQQALLSYGINMKTNDMMSHIYPVKVIICN